MNTALTPSLPHPLTPSLSPTPSPASMPAAEMVYNDDQSVAWERMWDSF